MNVNEFPWRLTTASKKPPGAATPRGFSFLVLTALEQAVKPLADVVSGYACCDGLDECKHCFHGAHLLSMKMGRSGAALTGYHKLRPKATQARRMTFRQNFQKRMPQIVKSVAEVRLKPPEKRHIIAVSTE